MKDLHTNVYLIYCMRPYYRIIFHEKISLLLIIICCNKQNKKKLFFFRLFHSISARQQTKKKNCVLVNVDFDFFSILIAAAAAAKNNKKKKSFTINFIVKNSFHLVNGLLKSCYKNHASKHLRICANITKYKKKKWFSLFLFKLKRELGIE